MIVYSLWGVIALQLLTMFLICHLVQSFELQKVASCPNFTLLLHFIGSRVLGVIGVEHDKATSLPACAILIIYDCIGLCGRSFIVIHLS